MQDLIDVCGTGTQAVVDKFCATGFLYSHSDVVDVTHECVLRCWSKAQKWLEEESSARNFYLQLVDRRKLGGALGMSDLREVVRLKNGGALTCPWSLRYGSEADFQSVDKYIQNSRRNLRTQIGSGITLVGCFMILAVYTNLHSKTQEQNSRARELTAYAALSENDDPATAMYLGLSAARVVPKSPPPGFKQCFQTHSAMVQASPLSRAHGVGV